MKAWGLTDIGNVREVNQDTYRIQCRDDGTAGVFLVCDGMGGANAGEVASTMAAEAFLNALSDSWQRGGSREGHRQAYAAANETVFDAAQSNEDYAGMGTTMVTAVCAGDRALIANVGDSRAYFLDENGLRQITEDRLEQRAFARAVAADHGRDLAAVGVQAHVVHQHRLPGAHRDVLDL